MRIRAGTAASCHSVGQHRTRSFAQDADRSLRTDPLAFATQGGRSRVNAEPSLQQAIQDHLDLKQRNEALEQTMPLEAYLERPARDEQADEHGSTDRSWERLWAAPTAFDWGE
jgi:hypothetical protein